MSSGTLSTTLWDGAVRRGLRSAHTLRSTSHRYVLFMSLSIKEYNPVCTVPDNIWAMMGMPSRGLQLQQLVHQGVPIAFFKRLAATLDIPESRLRQSLCISPSTLFKRAAVGRLNTLESDRLCSLINVLDAAYSLFENDLGMAREWMRAPVLGLDSRSPLEMMKYRVEAQAVIDLIGRLETGVHA